MTWPLLDQSRLTCEFLSVSQQQRQREWLESVPSWPLSNRSALLNGAYLGLQLPSFDNGELITESWELRADKRAANKRARSNLSWRHLGTWRIWIIFQFTAQMGNLFDKWVVLVVWANRIKKLTRTKSSSRQSRVKWSTRDWNHYY